MANAAKRRIVAIVGMKRVGGYFSETRSSVDIYPGIGPGEASAQTSRCSRVLPGTPALALPWTTGLLPTRPMV